MRLRSLAYQTPRFPLYENATQHLVLQANLAIQIIPGLYVGGGLTYMSRTQGQVYLTGNVDLGSPDSSSLTAKVDVDLEAVRYGQVGFLWEASRRLSFGICYRHKFSLSVDQAFRIDGTLAGSNAHFAARSVSTDLFQPWQLQAGTSALLLRWLRVNFDLAYVRWSDFPVPAARLDLDVDLGPFNNLVKLPGGRTYPSAQFRDIVVPRIGVEARVYERRRIGLDLRGGYAYEATPAPEQIGESNFADSDKHTFALGLGVELRDLRPILALPLALDAHVAVTYLPNRANHKLDPADPVGDFVAAGVVPQIGATLRSRF
jgi:long-subunit fatty acid transport protein